MGEPVAPGAQGPEGGARPVDAPTPAPDATEASHGGQVARLEERLRVLAQEKASLQLVNYMMGKLGEAAGPEGTAEALVSAVMEHLGGTHHTCHWRQEQSWRSVDVLGQRSDLAAPEDPRVRQVFKTGQAVEIVEPHEATQVSSPPSGEAASWYLPLAVGPEVVGVLELHGLQGAAPGLRPALPAFFRYAAVLLKHELEVATRLRKAREQVQLAEALARSQEQLRQSQKMDALGQLAGGVAHDFKNVLQVIVGFASMLRASVQGDGERDYADEVLAAARRGAELTRGLLTFSRRQPLELHPVDLNEVVGEARRFLERLLGEHVALDWALEAGPLPVKGDATHLQQVLVNLATNARDAMRTGGRLTVRTMARDAAPRGAPSPDEVAIGDPPQGPVAMVTVTDTGAGIPREVLAHVLEPFFTTKERGQGTGLGLSIIYGIVRQHGGHLRLRSVVGEGTQVTLVLPRTEALPPARPEPEQGEARVCHESVLVVEDEPGVRRVLRLALQSVGYRVEEAVDGLQAVERYQAGQRFDLLLLDLVMPRLDGREALEQIRALVPGQRAILMSGYASSATEVKGLASLQVTLLQKPSTPPELLRTVRAVLDQG